jgi:hypothetical protein
MLTPTESQTSELVQAGRSALDAIRGSLIDLYSAVGADLERPQEVARRFGLNRNLTWKLARVITAQSPFAALNHLPGKPGIELALSKFESAGATPESIASVRKSVADFMEVVTQHAGDRDQFELTLESMGLFEREYRVETARELAFRGNSMIWGVQCRTRVTLSIMAPETASSIIQVQIGGLVGFRRLRPSASWRLYRMNVDNDRGSPIGKPQPLMPVNEGEIPFVLRSMCSASVPKIEIVDSEVGRDYMLAGGPVGNLGAFDCYFGYKAVGLPRLRDENNEYSASATSISVPAELLIHDLLIHRDIAPVDVPEVVVYGFPHGGLEGPGAQTARNEIPCNVTINEVDGGVTSLATPRLPRYHKQVNSILDLMAWNPADFRVYRVQMAYPIMSSRVVVRFPLKTM